MDSLALGIDVGTSGVRVLAMDRRGRTVASAGVSMEQPVAGGGQISQDAAVWADAFNAVLAELAGQCPFAAVAAIAIDGTSGTILAVDQSGAPLAPALMYNDPSGKTRGAGFAALAPPDSAALGATSPLARALILQEVAGVTRILHQADWLSGRLSGRFDVTDENNALKTGYDPVARRWPEWIVRAGLDPALLPRVIPAGTRTGDVSAEAASRYGLPRGAAIVAGTTDGCAAFLATGASEAGDAVTSLGTTLTVKLLSVTPVFAPSFGIYSHRIGETWLAGGASNSGGAALLKHFSRERMAELEPSLRPDTPTGLDYYPLPSAGERFPVDDPALEPRVSPRPASDAVFFQGLLEGIARIEQEGYRRLGELGASPLASIRTAGGGASNRAWTDIRRRYLNVPFRESANLEAAAGTARLAWRGIGVSV